MASDSTSDRIVVAALALFLRQGVRKTNVDEVAFQTGLTRVTVYRYFGDKRGLVRAVCLRIAAIFQQAAEAGPADSTDEMDQRLSRLGEELAALPEGNLLARLEEISRLYPEVYEEFRAVRQAAVDAIFQQSLAVAVQQGTLREELNPEVLKAIFWSAVLGLIENPAMISSNVSLTEIFTTVTAVFRHGILKDSPERKRNAKR
jgi:AcrR family transcriptional regulator